jgi:hypothetical protein
MEIGERELAQIASVEVEKISVKLVAGGYELHKIEVCGEPRKTINGLVSVPLTVTVLKYVDLKRQYD